MITFKELQGDNSLTDIPIAHQQNMQDLLVKVNKIRAAYNKPLIVTSGYRSMQDHLRIYRSKGVKDDKIPMKSAHLRGLACDLYDPKGELKKFILDNIKLLEDNGLYCEDFAYSPNWVHVQSVPPASGKRFFIP